MRVARVVLVAALWLGACNGGDGRTDDTLPPRPSSTDTTAPDYSVPAVIDVAYVEKVMAALDHVYGDAIRTLARERKITEEFLQRLAAIYGSAQYDRTQQLWVRDVAGGLPDLASAPGDPRTIIQQLVKTSHECVVIRVDRDFSATNTRPDNATPQEFIALAPKPSGRDARSFNPTPWVIAFDGYIASPAGAEPDEPCARV